jgi:predicted DNA-binding transcriptional regulator AlpA
MSFESPTHHSSLTAFLTKAQEASKMSDHEMTEALGFSRTNVYTAIKQGTMKLPVGKVPLVARALEVSASEVLEVLLRDYSPEMLEVIRKVWGPLDLTTNERKLIEAYRTLAQGRDVEPLVMDGRNVVALITT